MATSNFYTNNARAVYAVSTQWEDEGERFNLDFEDILDNIHEAAKSRLNNSERFYKSNEYESHNRRDAGTICLTYEAPALNLPGGQTIEAEGQIILRFGYYEGANIDWNFLGKYPRLL